MEEKIKELKSFKNTLRSVETRLLKVSQGVFEELLEDSFKEAKDSIEMMIEDLEEELRDVMEGFDE